MITTSDSPGYIDYAAFGVSADDLRSVQSLATIWSSAFPQIATCSGREGALAEFVLLTNELPTRIADTAWQSVWLRAWHRLSGQGFTLSEMFDLFNRAVGCCEHELYGNRPQVSRIQLELIAILRRCVIAAVSCAIELGDEARTSAAGLPGELAAMQRLREMIAGEREVAVLSVAMDGRRTFSHLSAGEVQSIPSLLTEKLARQLRSEDLIFGGREGEWLLLLPDVGSMAQPVLAAAQIKRAFSEPIVLLSGRGMVPEVDIGVAMGPEHGSDALEVIQAARLARACAQSNRESFVVFDDALRQNWQTRYELSDELRQAIQREGLTLFIQPQVDTASGRCFGGELLLRWQRANGEWVPPPLIMELIEENGWRAEFTDWLIRSALRCSSELEQAGVVITLSLNLTAGDMVDGDLPEMVAQCLETWHLSGDRFVFELTESALMADHDRCQNVMQRLRQLGIHLALDDFGTGYSSLSYLVTMPLNEIKIDRSFVVSMGMSADNLRIVRSIIDLAHDLGMSSLAEGVEEASQREQLKALGCHQVQGYLYGKPMPQDQFVTWFLSRQA